MNRHPVWTRRLELRQQRLRIEDIAARPLGPLPFHQPHYLHIVEVGEARRLRVENLEAAFTGAKGKGLRTQPAADDC